MCLLLLQEVGKASNILAVGTGVGADGLDVATVLTLSDNELARSHGEIGAIDTHTEVSQGLGDGRDCGGILLRVLRHLVGDLQLQLLTSMATQ